MLSREKFDTLVHYVCWRCQDDPSILGAVKLNKVLWRTDFAAYYRHGRSVTGARYVKRKFGPVPASIVPALKDLQADGKLNVLQVGFHGLKKPEYRVLVEPELRLLSDVEQAEADRAIEFVCRKHTAKSISDLSHDNIWHAAEDGEEIPYYTVFAIPSEITDHDREWALAQLESTL